MNSDMTPLSVKSLSTSVIFFPWLNFYKYIFLFPVCVISKLNDLCNFKTFEIDCQIFIQKKDLLNLFSHQQCIRRLNSHTLNPIGNLKTEKSYLNFLIFIYLITRIKIHSSDY